MPKQAGRPYGATPEVRKDLDRIADMLVRGQVKTHNKGATTILRKRYPDWQDADKTTYDSKRRNLNRCWKKQGEERLKAAQERYDETIRSRQTSRTRNIGHAGGVDLSNLGLSGGVASAVREAQALQRLVDQYTLPQSAVEQAAASLSAGLRPISELIDDTTRAQLFGITSEIDKIQALIDPVGLHFRK